MTLLVGTHTGGEDCTSTSPNVRRCNYNIDAMGKPIIIQGQPGYAPSSIVVDCGLTAFPSSPTRGFIFHSGETNATVLRRITVRNCRALRGIKAGSCYPTTTAFPPQNRGLLFPTVPAHVGGGIVIHQANPRITNVVVEHCRAGVGGGVWIGSDSNATLNKVHVTACVAASGSAIAVVGATAFALDNTQVANNHMDMALGVHETCQQARTANEDGASTPGGVYQRIETNAATSWCAFTIPSAAAGGRDKGYLIVDNQRSTESVMYEFNEALETFLPVATIPHPAITSDYYDLQQSNYAHVQINHSFHALVYTAIKDNFIRIYRMNNLTDPVGLDKVVLFQEIDLRTLFLDRVVGRQCICQSDGTIGDGSQFDKNACEGLFYRRSDGKHFIVRKETMKDKLRLLVRKAISGYPLTDCAAIKKCPGGQGLRHRKGYYNVAADGTYAYEEDCARDTMFSVGARAPLPNGETEYVFGWPSDSQHDKCLENFKTDWRLALEEVARDNTCANPESDTCDGVSWTGVKWGAPNPPQTITCEHCGGGNCGGSTGIHRCCNGTIQSCNETEFNKDIDCTETIVSGASNGITFTFNGRIFFAATVGHIMGHTNDEISNRQTIVYEYSSLNASFELHSVLETPGAHDVEVFEIEGDLFMLVAQDFRSITGNSNIGTCIDCWLPSSWLLKHVLI